MSNQGSIDFRSRLNSSEPLIHTLINAYMMSGALFSCTELDLFSHLDQTPGARLDELAVHCGISTEQTRKLLCFCLSVGLVRQEEERYYCSDDARKLLSRHSPDNLCAAMAHHRRHVYPLFAELSDSLRRQAPICHRLGLGGRDGSEFYAELDKGAEDFDLFMSAMNTFSRGAGTRLAEIIASHTAVDRPLRVLDLGGGGGQVAIELARSLPDAQIMLVDLPKAVNHAQEQIQAQGLEHRIRCQAGDIFSPLPLETPFDIVLLSAVLGDWSLDYQRRLLANAYLHLSPGGWLVVSETLLDDDLGGPILPALMSLYVQLLTEGGENFTASGLTRLLQDNGFEQAQVHYNRAHGCRDTVMAQRL